MSKSKAPIVAIVGRANVGKSSIFNAILGSREAITADEPGTTRDNITARASVIVDDKERNFWVVDTAGLKDPEDDFELTIQEQIKQAADSADIIMVTIEANIGIAEEDRRVANMALKTKKPVILIANKSDKAQKKADLDEELKKLGIKTIVKTSAVQRTGIDELLEALVEFLPDSTILVSDNTIRLALVGRPNAGKSALFNSLAKKQQAIVSERAGTTRDVNRIKVSYKKKNIELLDTAGIRRSGKIQKGVEKFSVIKALSVIESSDICLLIMDVNELNVQLDQRIAGLVKEAGKGLVLVVSKWDSLGEKDAYTRDKIAPRLSHTLDFVPWSPLIFTSAITGQNVTKLFDLAIEIMERRGTRISTAELNRWLRRAVDAHPPAGLKNRSPKLNYMVQETDNPTPAFKIFSSHSKFVHWSYRRYLERKLREEFGFEGTPVQLWFIDKNK